MSAKVYPLDIWTWRSCYAASWGHHDFTIFLNALHADWDIRPPISRSISHAYARLGFDTEGEGRMVCYAKGPGRGVRPITEVEW